MNKTSVFAFDFDGVIADSAQAYVNAINSVAVNLGATRQMSCELLAGMRDYRHAHSAALIGVAESQLPRYSQGLRDYFHQYSEYSLVTAMGPLLQRLSPLGSVVVLSANEQTVIEAAIAELDVAVDDIYAGHGREDKARVLTRLAAEARVLMIGDTLSDCDAAANAKVDAVAVSWGWQGCELLTEARVPIVDSPVQLQQWILDWCRA